MKRRSAEVQIDLFPFLSILVCMMGVLTLLITGIVLSQINPVAVAEVIDKVADEEDLSEDLKKLEDELKRQQDALTKIEQQPKIKQPANDLPKLDAQIAAVQKQIAALKSKRESAATEAQKLQDLVDQLSARLAELEPELKARQEHIVKLETELSKRKGAKKGPSVRVLPAGTGFLGSKKPVFVDCDRVGATLHAGGKMKTIQRPQLDREPEWLKMLERNAKSKKEIVVFLVRRDGIGTYNLAKRAADRLGATHGKIPVAFDGELDLSLFNKGGG
jgi:archaellum component FlaC